MIEFVITVVLIALLIMFFKKRINFASCCPSKEPVKSEPTVPEQVKQQPETNPEVTEATVVTPPEPKPANIEPSAKPQVKEAAVSPVEHTYSSLLPQDSILKRHYLNHVCMMIESIAPPRPTDSVLCRHYDAMIVTEIDQSLNDKKAMEQLIHAYENKK